MTDLPVGLQLYTLRAETARDFQGTLAQVARLGYRAVEFAGYGGLRAPDLKRLLADLGLTPIGAHVALEKLEHDLDAEAEFALELGMPFLTVPWWQATDAAGWRDLTARLEALAPQVSARGLRLCYHNHAHELREQVEGQPVLDFVLEQAPSLGAELDVAWIDAGGQDPRAYLARFAGRAPLVHLKDYRAGEPRPITVELGAGQVDLPGVLDAAREAGAEWLIVEQDDSDHPLESVERSLAWLRRRGLVAS